MATATIDTLEIAQEPRRAGVPEPQAEAIVHVFERRYDSDRDELITRSYLDVLPAKPAAEIARSEPDLILKMAGIVTTAVAIVGTLGIPVLRLRRSVDPGATRRPPPACRRVR